MKTTHDSLNCIGPGIIVSVSIIVLFTGSPARAACRRSRDALNSDDAVNVTYAE